MRSGYVDRWAQAGIITQDQRAEIETFERGRARRPAITASELLTYVGMVVLVAGLSPVAASLPPAGRAALLTTLCVTAGAAGAALFRADGDSLDRTASVLWFFSVLFAAGAGVALSGSGQRGAARPLLSTGVPAMAFAALYWWHHRSGPQLLALYTSVLLVVYGFANVVADLTPISGALLLAWIGAAGLAATARGAVEPEYVAHHLFGFSLTLGFFIAGLQPGGGWAELATIGAAGFILWISMRQRSTELLYVGALSLWVVSMSVVTRHFMRTTSMPWVMLLAGGALIAVAVRVSRTKLFAERDPEHQT